MVGLSMPTMKYVRLTGHAHKSEILGHSIIEWTASYDSERNIDSFKSCIIQGFIYNFEIDYVSLTGDIIPVEVNARVIETDGGSRIVTLCRDYSEKRKNDIQRQNHIKRLEKIRAIDQAILSADSVVDIANYACRQLRSQINCSRASLITIDNVNKTGTVIAVDNEENNNSGLGLVFPVF